MQQDIHLYIEDKEVEFTKPPEILFNYKVTDLLNPTILKNSFTRTLTINGTNRNNDIFGHMWNLERIQYYGSSASFNPLKKVGFTLYYNGNIYEKGYCKLDSITRQGNQLEYSITLYGGLGEFFYNLTYSSEELNNRKLTLADLRYTVVGDTVDPDLSFRINKNTVWDAWQTILGNPYPVYSEDDAQRPTNYLYDDKWNVINFAPCYNGTPSDFDSNRFLINTRDLTSYFTTQKTVDGTVYTSYNGYVMGEMPTGSFTEWNTLDLRSYLQRPVISMRRIIEACRDGNNNGGYEVILDPHFFNEDNPYYSQAFVTLPMLRDLEIKGGEDTTINDASLTRETSRFIRVNTPTTTFSSFSNLDMAISVDFTPAAATTAQNLYTHTQLDANISSSSHYVRRYISTGAVIVQLLAFDSSDNIIGQSKGFVLTDDYRVANTTTPITVKFYDPSATPDIDPTTGEGYEWLKGHWVRQADNSYKFCLDSTGQPTSVRFSILGGIEFDHLKIKMKFPYSYYIKYTNAGNNTESDFVGNAREYGLPLYTALETSTSAVMDKDTAIAVNRVDGTFSVNIDSFSIVATDYEAFFSNTLITKEKLLGTKSSPADYLLSYAKLFGLYFYIDPSEESSNAELYPKGVIHIVDRNTFYKKNEIVNLEKLIDRGKNMTIQPTTAASKWYDFNVEQIESEANNSYTDTYGYDYGRQLVNTGYDFDADTKELYEGSAFKGGIMVLEKDKYYSKPVNGIPAYVNNGLTYNLFHSNGDGFETCSIDYPITKSDNVCMNLDGLANYDAFPKPQFHLKDNESTDGDGVLLFFNGTISATGGGGMTRYWLTDDLSPMITLNDSSPCWILTANELDNADAYIAYRILYFPYFTRYYMRDFYNGYVVHSWDFGNPQATFIPKGFNTAEMGIYSKCWRNFISDLYNVDNRRLDCYVRTDNTPTVDWLRRFYWFDNSIWRLNEIKDWKVGSNSTTEMEFVKVQDIENYSLDSITYDGAFYILMTQTTVADGGGTVAGSVYSQSGESWTFDALTATDAAGNIHTFNVADYVSPTTGSGLTTAFTVTVPANTTGLKLHYSLTATNSSNVIAVGNWYQDADSNGVIIWNIDSLSRTYNFREHTDEVLLFTYNNIDTSTVTVVSSDNSMITDASVDVAEGSFSMTVATNNRSASRQCTLTISATDLNNNVRSSVATITQNGYSLTLSTANAEFDYTIEPNVTGTITITTNTNWTITSEDN